MSIPNCGQWTPKPRAVKHPTTEHPKPQSSSGGSISGASVPGPQTWSNPGVTFPSQPAPNFAGCECPKLGHPPFPSSALGPEIAGGLKGQQTPTKRLPLLGEERAHPCPLPARPGALSEPTPTRVLAADTTHPHLSTLCRLCLEPSNTHSTLLFQLIPLGSTQPPTKIPGN